MGNRSITRRLEAEKYEGIRLRPAQWEVETATKVMDPDGWRSPYAKDYATPIDYAEWSWRMAMSTIQMGLSPDTELLPAEERLQNALMVIEKRIKFEQMILSSIIPDDGPVAEKQRAFVQGLDIAWSLVSTESLRRQTPGTQK